VTLLCGILVIAVISTNSILGHLFLFLVKDCLGEIKIGELAQIEFRVSHRNSSFHGLNCLSQSSDRQSRPVLTGIVATVRRNEGSVGVQSISMAVRVDETIKKFLVFIERRRGLNFINGSQTQSSIDITKGAERTVKRQVVIERRRRGRELINGGLAQSGINITQRAQRTVRLLMVIDRNWGLRGISMTGAVHETVKKLQIAMDKGGSLKGNIGIKTGVSEPLSNRLLAIIVDARVRFSHRVGRGGRHSDAHLSGGLFVSLVKIV
jgi:hypothetical protein